MTFFANVYPVVKVTAEHLKVKRAEAPARSAFTVREAQRTWLLAGDETPTGAFSYDGKMFVFILAQEGFEVSSLTRSCCPASRFLST